ncbi:MAG: HEAT repeat domain-containing protein [Chloroflexi bacterium]|nr:HEAT repeat domain-containing protein [Chloroflexota bacterium]
MTTGSEPRLSASDPSERAPALGNDLLLPHLIDSLSDPDEAVRERAMRRMAQLGTQEATAHLLRMVRKAEGYTKTRAIRALGDLREPAATAALLDLAADPDELMRVPVYEALGHTGDARVVPLLKALYETHDASRVVLEVIARALGRLYHEQPEALHDLARHAVEGYLDRRDWAWRSTRLFQAVAPPAFIPYLLGIAEDPTQAWQRRSRAMRALGYIGDKEITPRIVELVSDDNGHVANTAADVLKKLRRRDDIATLVGLLHHESWQVRRRALNILSIRRVRSCIEDYARLLSDGRAAVRAEACRALARVRATEHLPAMEALLEDRTNQVREVARYTVNHLRYYSSIPSTVSLQSSGSRY